MAEIANTQSELSLNKKIHNWTHGSRQHLKFIIAFRIEPLDTAGHRVLVSVDRLHINPTPTPANPNMFVTVPRHLIVREEVYPRVSAATFNIARADVLPKNVEDDPTVPANEVTINLSSFKGYARAGVDNLKKKARARTPSPRDPDEVSVPSPTASYDEVSDSSLSSNNDKPYDKTWKGKGVDRGDSRGIGTRSSGNRTA